MIQKRPVIGITLGLVNKFVQGYYSTSLSYTLKQNCADSVIKAGGIPLVVPYQYDTIGAVLAMLDGLIIPGGEDIHPKFYSQQPICDNLTVNEQRDNFELLILKKALESNLPFLRICRGMQLLNVVCGGDLIQDIPNYMKSQSNITPTIHKPSDPNLKYGLSHSITIQPNTILAELSNNQASCLVNSNHHQAIAKLGEGLTVGATAPDGIIEAIESTNHKFVIGVEWHPKYLNSNDLDLNIFKGLITAVYDNL